LEVVVLAPTAIYGPHDYACSPLTRLLVDLYKKRWPVLVDCGYDLVDVRDVVEVAMEAEQHAPSGSKYQVAGHFVSFRELARLVASIAGVKSSPICVPPWGGLAVAYAAVALSKMTGSLPVTTPASVRVVSNKHRRFSHARATQELGYQPRSPRDSLSTTLCWLRDSGMLRGASDS
jgi:nucleoside-diphosphate-sugar epimerase